jgi:hypothetical protein
VSNAPSGNPWEWASKPRPCEPFCALGRTSASIWFAKTRTSAGADRDAAKNTTLLDRVWGLTSGRSG